MAGLYALQKLLSSILLTESPFARMAGQCYKQLKKPMVIPEHPSKEYEVATQDPTFSLTNFQIALLILLGLVDIGLIAIVIRLLAIDLHAVTGLYIFTCAIITLINYYRMTRFRGSMKRGIPIWRENLPKNIEVLLRDMWQEVENGAGFIRMDGNLRLICSHSWFFGTPWPFVGYIDLSVQSPKIEYRVGGAGFLVLIPFLIVFSPFVFLVLIASYFAQRAGIYHFILNNAR